jgi:chromosome segregation ATPase
MKYIEKHYQDLIEQIESAHEYVVGDLKAHINWLEKKIAGEDELAEQIEEYENFKSDCAACDVVIRELREENAKLKEEIASLKKTTVKAKAPRKRARKQVLCTCQDCKTYFYAQRRDAKRCPECKRKHNNQAKYAWLKKQRAAK